MAQRRTARMRECRRLPDSVSDGDRSTIVIPERAMWTVPHTGPAGPIDLPHQSLRNLAVRTQMLPSVSGRLTIARFEIFGSTIFVLFVVVLISLDCHQPAE